MKIVYKIKQQHCYPKIAKATMKENFGNKWNHNIMNVLDFLNYLHLIVGCFCEKGHFLLSTDMHDMLESANTTLYHRVQLFFSRIISKHLRIKIKSNCIENNENGSGIFLVGMQPLQLHCLECPFRSPHIKGAGCSNSRLGLSAGFEGCTRHPLRA